MSPEAAVTPEPTVAELEAMLATQEADYDLMRPQVDAIFDAADDQAKQDVEAAGDDYAKVWDEARANNQPAPAVTNFFEARLAPSPLRDAAITLMEHTAALENTAAQLEQRAPAVAEALQARVTGLATQIDYPKMATAMFDAENRVSGSAYLRDDFSRVLAVGQFLARLDVPTPSYQQLKHAEAFVSKQAAAWAEAGLLAEVPDPTNTIEDVTNVVTAELNTVESDLLADSKLCNRYGNRTIKRGKHRSEAELEAFMSAVKGPAAEPPTTLDEVTWRSVTAYNPAMAAVVRDMLGQKLAAVEQVRQTEVSRTELEARTIDADQALAELEISGDLGRLPAGLTEDDMRSFLRDNIPPLALARTTSLKFHTPDATDEADWRTLGTNTLDGTTAKITIFTDTLDYLDAEELEHADGKVAKVVKLRLLETITHEFGHSLHRNLPMTHLRQWEEARSSDRTNVTNYVKDRHDTDHPGRYNEDFAESMALFVTRPDMLFAISPARFNALKAIFTDLMPNYKNGLKQEQLKTIAYSMMANKALGISDEDFRAMCLIHEDR